MEIICTRELKPQSAERQDLRLPPVDVGLDVLEVFRPLGPDDLEHQLHRPQRCRWRVPLRQPPPSLKTVEVAVVQRFQWLSFQRGRGDFAGLARHHLVVSMWSSVWFSGSVSLCPNSAQHSLGLRQPAAALTWPPWSMLSGAMLQRCRLLSGPRPIVGGVAFTLVTNAPLPCGILFHSRT